MTSSPDPNQFHSKRALLVTSLRDRIEAMRKFGGIISDDNLAVFPIGN
jgi:hypothetical protein